MWEFIFGKDEIMIDNLSLMIKNYIYQLRNEHKHFSDKQFLYEVDLRFKADMTENNRKKLNMNTNGHFLRIWQLSFIN